MIDIDLTIPTGRRDAAAELRDIAQTIDKVVSGEIELIAAGWSVRYLRSMADALETIQVARLVRLVGGHDVVDEVYRKPAP